MISKSQRDVRSRDASSSLRKPIALISQPIRIFLALLILCGQLGVVNAGSLERFRSASVRQPPSLHGESIDLEGAQDESRSDSTLPSHPLSCSLFIKKVSANAIPSGKFRSVSVRCPLSLSPGEKIQPTERAAESLPRTSFFQNLSLRLKSPFPESAARLRTGRAGYGILGKPGSPHYLAVIQQVEQKLTLTPGIYPPPGFDSNCLPKSKEKPSLSVVTPEDMQRILAGISRSTKKHIGIRSTKDIKDLSAEKRMFLMAILLGRCKTNKWYRRKNEDVFPDEIILIYLISKADLKEGEKQKLPDIVNMALTCTSEIYRYSRDNFKFDLKSAAIAAFDRIYQDHSELGLNYEAIDHYKTIEYHS
ncbi:hypothetical protein PSTT_13044 [Puccinia striiformis]|uniref:Uncharacterized protein n=1 Tax=Puccinia striiformis TaxID=27350 RepID=A0A2S4UTJ6_9BASI|nr:hypothetical protein PSTT_13044 [Puccinia striiformis]